MTNPTTETLGVYSQTATEALIGGIEHIHRKREALIGGIEHIHRKREALIESYGNPCHELHPLDQERYLLNLGRVVEDLFTGTVGQAQNYFEPGGAR